MISYDIADVYIHIYIYNVWEVYHDYVVMCLVLESLTNVESCCSGIIPKNQYKSNYMAINYTCQNMSDKVWLFKDLKLTISVLILDAKTWM